MSKGTEKARAVMTLIVDMIEDAIKEAGEDGIPSGHLYAMLCGMMHVDTFNSFIDHLEKEGKITNKGHLLKTVK